MNLVDRLKTLKNDFVRRLESTPDYKIKFVSREDVGIGYVEVKRYDSITNWEIPYDKPLYLRTLIEN